MILYFTSTPWIGASLQPLYYRAFHIQIVWTIRDLIDGKRLIETGYLSSFSSHLVSYFFPDQRLQAYTQFSLAVIILYIQCKCNSHKQENIRQYAHHVVKICLKLRWLFTRTMITFKVHITFTRLFYIFNFCMMKICFPKKIVNRLYIVWDMKVSNFKMQMKWRQPRNLHNFVSNFATIAFKWIRKNIYQTTYINNENVFS